MKIGPAEYRATAPRGLAKPAVVVRLAHVAWRNGFTGRRDLEDLIFRAGHGRKTLAAVRALVPAVDPAPRPVIYGRDADPDGWDRG